MTDEEAAQEGAPGEARGQGTTPPDSLSDVRRRGLDTMEQVYGWQMPNLPGDFFGITVDHLFADIWNRPGLTIEQRRLMLIGVAAALRLDDILTIQLEAALKQGELDQAALREVAIFLTHYIGWPAGTRVNAAVETVVKRSESS